jgi:hypothetical protein
MSVTITSSATDRHLDPQTSTQQISSSAHSPNTASNQGEIKAKALLDVAQLI